MRVFICPQPIAWNTTFQALREAWEESGSRGDSPPVPLILAGWVYSTDHEKQRRWQETVRWADEHGFRSLIPKLEEQEQYRTTEVL